MPRKLARVLISDALLTDWLQHGFRQKAQAVKGLPLDAGLIAANFDGRDVTLIYESESFAPVPEGEVIPLFEVTFKAIEG